MESDQDTGQSSGQSKEQSKTRAESSKTMFIFFMFGFLVYAMAGVITSSAEDFLNGHDASTGMIWLSISLPTTVLSTIVPYLFDRSSPVLIILLVFPINGSAVVCLLMGKTLWTKYLVIFLFGVSGSLIEVTSVSLTAYFDKVTVTAYCVGTGVSFIVGPSYYTVMTSWFHLFYKIPIIISCLVQPTLFLICYLLLEKRRESALMGYKSVAQTDKDSNKNAEDLNERNPNKNAEDTNENANRYLTFSEKMRATLKISPLIFQIFLGNFSLDFVLSGITTTIAFSSSPFSPAEHYRYYLMLAFLGLFFGRSYLGFAEFIRPGLSDRLLIRNTWLLSGLSLGHVVLLVFASLYRFLPDVWVTLFLVFSLGFWSESIYGNVNVLLGEIEDSRVRELSMGLAVFGVEFGAMMGAIVSGPIEDALLKHCLTTTNETITCLTRDVFNATNTA